MGDSGKMVARQENLSIHTSCYSLGHLEVRIGQRQQRVSTGGWANALSSPSDPGAPDSSVFPSAIQIRGLGCWKMEVQDVLFSSYQWASS